MTAERAQMRLFNYAMVQRMLRRVASNCRQSGFQVESIVGTRALSIEDTAAVHLSGNTYRTYTIDRCLLSCQNLTPLYSSHLIRTDLKPAFEAIGVFPLPRSA